MSYDEDVEKRLREEKVEGRFEESNIVTSAAGSLLARALPEGVAYLVVAIDNEFDPLSKRDRGTISFATNANGETAILNMTRILIESLRAKRKGDPKC